ncbi:hypothetical protein F8M41_025682 [Gigaspora margarita]|uniref:Uncharacterized protein n=1 Tax=Gigaspora margarita TaxID=4874 RepID=A0A8H4B005_GIGMA|nr:hypothetical protein F8M41_025682 [Gigaspora margarita]
MVEKALILSYLKVAAPDHKKLLKNKYNNAREYLSKQIGVAAAEKKLLNSADKYALIINTQQTLFVDWKLCSRPPHSLDGELCMIGGVALGLVNKTGGVLVY